MLSSVSPSLITGSPLPTSTNVPGSNVVCLYCDSILTNNDCHDIIPGKYRHCTDSYAYVRCNVDQSCDLVDCAMGEIWDDAKKLCEPDLG